MHSINVRRKKAVGTLTTATYAEKAEQFQCVYEENESVSNLLPLKQYLGKGPKPPVAGKEDDYDKFDRRIVPQLSDISFEEDSEDDFEDVKNIKRQAMTVLTEANLRKILDAQTSKLNLEHHYWLKDNFLNKLGRLAPNLKELSLRRLNISNESFTDIFRYCKFVEKLDICDCPSIEESGMDQFLLTAPATFKSL
jgi:hypothetical protein